jgi:hypothetical protein
MVKCVLKIGVAYLLNLSSSQKGFFSKLIVRLGPRHTYYLSEAKLSLVTLAAKYNNRDMVRVLLQSGANSLLVFTELMALGSFEFREAREKYELEEGIYKVLRDASIQRLSDPSQAKQHKLEHLLRRVMMSGLYSWAYCSQVIMRVQVEVEELKEVPQTVQQILRKGAAKSHKIQCVVSAFGRFPRTLVRGVRLVN